MQRFRNMSINRKLTLVILLTCTAVLLLAAAAMICTELITSRRALEQDMTVLADLLGRNSTAALSFHRDEDVDEVTRMLSALQADPHIIAACLYDKDGNFFGQYARAGSATNLPRKAPREGRWFAGGHFQVAQPVAMEGKQIGMIYLRADLGRMYRQLALHAAIVLLMLLAIFVMTFALSPRLRRPIAEPILALAGVARRIGENKDYSIRAEKQSEDEVGLLTDAFNQMLGEIERSHDALAIAKDAAEAANRAKDQFLAVLSHELRTPLTPVLLTISLLQHRGEQLPGDVQADIQTIRRHVELEARLIDDLLDLTRIARGKMQLNLETVDVHTLVRDALKICCSERMQDVTLALEAVRHQVRGDAGRLLQVFWNLLNNAQKFTPVGSPIAIRSSNVQDDRIRIEVIDAGVGIDLAALPRIFNAFEQGELSVNRNFGGLGLGLTIAKALLDAHGGSITARSDGPKRGATFTVEMPVVPARVPTQAIVASQPPAPARKGLRVLVVEDHEGTLRVMAKLLQGVGHDVVTAGSVQAALAIAVREKIDLVISDIGLPDGSGFDLMKELRDRFGLKGICMSGYGMEHDIARGAEAGFCDHLTKPIDLGKLQRAIEAAVAKPM